MVSIDAVNLGFALAGFACCGTRQPNAIGRCAASCVRRLDCLSLRRRTI